MVLAAASSASAASWVVADRFDPVPEVDPQIAYWVATVRGLPTVRSVTAVGGDATVVARDRDFDARPERNRLQLLRLDLQRLDLGAASPLTQA